jgi:dimeric dUTPase (all-alpha-NTP-PPase superfamily)
MNWLKLFELQSKLDKKINYNAADRLRHKFSALMVETAEAWNETRSFKFWSKNYNTYSDSLLDEFSDMHHFIMSIGLELQDLFPKTQLIKDYGEADELYDATELYMAWREFFGTISDLETVLPQAHLLPDDFPHEQIIENRYEDMVVMFLRLVESHNFTMKQLEQQYYEKNQVNHQRQATGY